MKKLALRLLAVLLSVYLAGSVLPLFATQQPAPPPSTPASPSTPPSGSPQLDSKLPPSHVAPPRDYGDEGCCGGGGGTSAPSEPAKPGAAELGGIEFVGQQLEDKGDAAKQEVNAAYSKARQILLDQVAAKYNLRETRSELRDVKDKISALKKDLNDVASAQSDVRLTMRSTELRAEMTELTKTERADHMKLQDKNNALTAEEKRLRKELATLEDQKTTLNNQINNITNNKDYAKEAARLDAAIAVGKAKRYQAIDAQVKKAKANAVSKFLGAKIPEGSTSSFDIMAVVPSVGSLVKELSAGK
jgi:hypothetical protein